MRQALPTTGSYPIKRFAKMLGASPRTIRNVCRRFGIPAKRGRVDAAVWFDRLTRQA